MPSLYSRGHSATAIVRPARDAEQYRPGPREGQSRQLLRGFPARPGDPARDAAHRDGGDAALYIGLTGSRFALHASNEFARALGFERAPIDDLLVFNIVFGKTVPDVSLNAIANLGYANGRFGAPVFAATRSAPARR